MFTDKAIEALQEQLSRDLLLFTPELLVCAGIVILLLFRLVSRARTVVSGATVPLFFTGLALLFVAVTSFDISWLKNVLDLYGFTERKEIFSGLLVIDHFTAFVRLLLLGFTMLVIWLSMLTGIPDEDDSADFYTLLLGATLGMMLMASANHLLMVFIAIEMASLPSYALAGFLKGRRQSSEASLKYVVYGGGASGVMLYGISLLSGRFGTGYLPNLATEIQGQMLRGSGMAGIDTIVLLGCVLVLVGLAFKLAAVPFHFWCPDVFEGAAAEVGAFLSVASKAAALALTGRLLLALTVSPFPPAGFKPEELAAIAQKGLGPAIAFLAAITATFGNLAAYPQTNLKRLLAYSTIAHAGYMLMGLSVLNSEGAKAVLFYLVAYVLMNLGAFAVVAFLRNRTGSEDLRQFRGLVYRSPLLVTLLGIFLLSLLGLPPLMGFAAKFQVFSALYHAGNHHLDGGRGTLAYVYYGLLIVGGINTVVSAVYYLKVLKVMVLERPLEELEARSAEPLRLPAGSVIYGSLLAVLIFAGMVAFNPIDAVSNRGASDFVLAIKKPPPAGGPAGAGMGAGGFRPPAPPPLPRPGPIGPPDLPK